MENELILDEELDLLFDVIVDQMEANHIQNEMVQELLEDGILKEGFVDDFKKNFRTGSVTNLLKSTLGNYYAMYGRFKTSKPNVVHDKVPHLINKQNMTLFTNAAKKAKLGYMLIGYAGSDFEKHLKSLKSLIFNITIPAGNVMITYQYDILSSVLSGNKGAIDSHFNKVLNNYIKSMKARGVDESKAKAEIERIKESYNNMEKLKSTNERFKKAGEKYKLAMKNWTEVEKQKAIKQANALEDKKAKEGRVLK